MHDRDSRTGQYQTGLACSYAKEGRTGQHACIADRIKPKKEGPVC
jgi:hypothetical protein